MGGHPGLPHALRLRDTRGTAAPTGSGHPANMHVLPENRANTQRAHTNHGNPPSQQQKQRVNPSHTKHDSSRLNSQQLKSNANPMRCTAPRIQTKYESHPKRFVPKVDTKKSP